LVIRVLAENKNGSRHVLLFTLGINTAQRVSDFLSLIVGDDLDEKGLPAIDGNPRKKDRQAQNIAFQ
jgi:hypothetical protein